jgi:phage-related minor tail protein
MSTTPTNVNDLVDQLVKYEALIRDLKRKNKALTMTNDRARQQAVAMHTKSTKKSSFTNYEVKQMSNSLLDALEKLPLLK